MRVDAHALCGVDELLLPILKTLLTTLLDEQIPIHFPTALLFDSFKSHALLSGIDLNSDNNTIRRSLAYCSKCLTLLVCAE
jgi:hypothetical protein